ncbi:MAG: peptidylprolyl isomerase [Planctomycetota bacterium]
MLRQIFAILFSASLLVAAPKSQGSGDPRAPQGKTAVMRLDGEDISWDEYSHWLIENFGAKLATNFAGDHLIEREAVRRGVEAAPLEIETELEHELRVRIDGAFLGSKDSWLAELERTQRSEAGFHTQRTQELRVDLLTRKTVAVDRVVPEAKIVREWELSYGRGGRAYDLSMLQVRCEFLTPANDLPNATKEKLRQDELDSKQRRALELRERIVKGGDFASIAREASDDESSRGSGGRPLHGFHHYGWPKSFLDALDQLGLAEISQPIYAKGGWWIVRVDGLRLTPLEQVRGELVARLEERGPEQDETGNFRNALVDAARVEILPTLFGEPARDVERSGAAPGLSIDGQPISRSTYAQWILRTRGESSWPNFVEHRVVFNEAHRRGIEVSDAEVRARSEDYVRRLILENHQGSREAWLATLKIKGREEAFFMHDLDVRMRIELLCERLMMLERTITPEAVRMRFEDVYGKDGKLIKVRMILLNVPLSSGPAEETREQVSARLAASKEAVRAKAQALVGSVRDGADFSSLARQHSNEPVSAARGGILEGRFRSEVWPESIAAKVTALDVGGVSDALEFGSSFVVLQVISREAVSFDSVKADLEAEMRSEPPPRPDLNLYRNSLVKKAKVEILPGMNP